MIAFTLCSNNYLAQAKTLGDSFVRHNPGVHFVIGLVDRRRDDVDYAALGPFEILPVEDLAIPSFEGFWKRYNIIELNTAVKPYYFAHLFERHGSDVVLYFDADIELYASCETILSELGEGAVLLTPHALAPVPVDDLGLSERAFLRCGVYNLGFITVADGPERAKFLDWWKARTARWGYISWQGGLFVDQLWINLAPVFFDRVVVTRHRGLNMAYWNLHERTLSAGPDGGLVVNGVYPLVFFHFSALDQLHPESIATTQKRTLASRPDLDRLFRGYAERVLANGYERYGRLECEYVTQRQEYLRAVRYRQPPTDQKRAPAQYLANRLARKGIRVIGRVLDALDAPLRRRFPRPDEDL
jgi:hypothetical protein